MTWKQKFNSSSDDSIFKSKIVIYEYISFFFRPGISRNRRIPIVGTVLYVYTSVLFLSFFTSIDPITLI